MRLIANCLLIMFAALALGTATVTLAGDRGQSPVRTLTRPDMGQQVSPSGVFPSSSHHVPAGRVYSPVEQGRTEPAPAGGFKPYRSQQNVKPTSGADSSHSVLQPTAVGVPGERNTPVPGRELQKANKTEASFDPSTLPQAVHFDRNRDVHDGEIQGVTDRDRASEDFAEHQKKFRDLLELLSTVSKTLNDTAMGIIRNVQ